LHLIRFLNGKRDRFDDFNPVGTSLKYIDASFLVGVAVEPFEREDRDGIFSGVEETCSDVDVVGVGSIIFAGPYGDFECAIAGTLDVGVKGAHAAKDSNLGRGDANQSKN
jgi:hypothetical protein